MNITFKVLGLSMSVALATLMAGCGTGSDNDDSTGGTSGTSGGAGNSGGKSGSSGGATSTGGASGGITKLFMFNGDHEGWSLNTYQDTNPQYRNLVAPPSDPAPTLGFSAVKDYGNDPASGSLRINAPYSFWNQSVSAEVSAPVDKTGAPIDFTHKTIKVEFMVEKGLSPFTVDPAGSAPGGVVFYMKSGTAYDWGQATWKNADIYGNWIQVKFNTDNLDPGSKSTFDPSNVVQMGLQFSSGGGGSHCPDTMSGDPNNAAFKGEPTATCPAWPDGALDTTIYIDTITVEPN